MSVIAGLRREFHSTLLSGTLTLNDKGIPSNADSSSAPSRRVARGILERIGHAATADKLPGQTAGANFESACEAFVAEAFESLSHLRPGTFAIRKGGAIHGFDQYDHLDELAAIARTNRDVATALGNDYLIKPDVVVSRRPLSIDAVNSGVELVDDTIAKLTPLLERNSERDILHASISCKWTLRSDRAQNARSEGLNLVRNRKGRLPHVVVVTGEPLPSRISSLALGTGDIDCVYHFALSELHSTLTDMGDDGYLDQLDMMIEGKRLRDIADLPLDLVV